MVKWLFASQVKMVARHELNERRLFSRGGPLRLEFGLFDERIECQGRFASSMPVPSAWVVRGFQSWLKKPRFLVVHQKGAVNLRDF
jgi:hypothetical protein